MSSTQFLPRFISILPTLFCLVVVGITPVMLAALYVAKSFMDAGQTQTPQVPLTLPSPPPPPPPPGSEAEVRLKFTEHHNYINELLGYLKQFHLGMVLWGVEVKGKKMKQA